MRQHGSITVVSKFFMRTLAKLGHKTFPTLLLTMLLILAGLLQVGRVSAMAGRGSYLEEPQENRQARSTTSRAGETNPNPYFQPVSADDSAAIILGKIGELQHQLQQLRGELEVQGHDLKIMRQQQQRQGLNQTLTKEGYDLKQKQKVATYDQLAGGVDLSAGKAKQVLISNSYVPKSIVFDTATPLIERQGEADQYATAYQLIEQKDFSAAIGAMQRYLADYPKGQYASNAIYWLGELYLAKRQPEQAVDKFNLLVKQYPDSNKVAPSMLKLGYAYYEMGLLGQARDQLRKVEAKFPDSNVSYLANTRLQSLNLEISKIGYIP